MQGQNAVTPHNPKWNYVPPTLGILMLGTLATGIGLYCDQNKNVSSDCNQLFFNETFNCDDGSCKKKIVDICHEILRDMNMATGIVGGICLVSALASTAVNIYTHKNLKAATAYLNGDLSQISRTEKARWCEVAWAILGMGFVSLFQASALQSKSRDLNSLDCFETSSLCSNATLPKDIIWERELSATKFKEKQLITGVVAAVFAVLTAITLSVHRCSQNRKIRNLAYGIRQQAMNRVQRIDPPIRPSVHHIGILMIDIQNQNNDGVELALVGPANNPQT